MGRPLTIWRQLGARLIQLAGVLLAISILTFVLGRLLPGDPARARLGPDATAQQVDQLRHQLGLDRSLPSQFWQWFCGALHGDFGVSAVTGQPVARSVFERVPVSLELVTLAEVMVLMAAVPAAVYLGWRRDSALDRAANRLAFCALSVPQFCVAIVLILVFALRLHWFPVTGYTYLSDDALQSLRSLILPAAALAVGLSARVFRLLRSEMIGTLQQEFIRTARAQGIRPRTILRRHALVVALQPVLTLTGLDFGMLIGGAVIVEQLFGLPGLGTFAMNAVTNRDFPSLQAVVLVLAAINVTMNFVVDLLHQILNPQLRHAH